MQISRFRALLLTISVIGGLMAFDPGAASASPHELRLMAQATDSDGVPLAGGTGPASVFHEPEWVALTYLRSSEYHALVQP